MKTPAKNIELSFVVGLINKLAETGCGRLPEDCRTPYTAREGGPPAGYRLARKGEHELKDVLVLQDFGWELRKGYLEGCPFIEELLAGGKYAVPDSVSLPEGYRPARADENRREDLMFLDDEKVWKKLPARGYTLFEEHSRKNRYAVPIVPHKHDFVIDEQYPTYCSCQGCGQVIRTGCGQK